MHGGEVEEKGSKRWMDDERDGGRATEHSASMTQSFSP
jgi:hypothetical protein